MYSLSLCVSQAPALFQLLGCHVVVVTLPTVQVDSEGVGNVDADPAAVMVAAYIRKGWADRHARKLREQGVFAEVHFMEGDINELRDMCKRSTVKTSSCCHK